MIRPAAAVLPNSVHTLIELHAHLPKADFVVLTCPLVPETRGVIGARELGLMPPLSYLVNVGRGPCVVETALVEALKSGRIAGAALDCTDPEPSEQDSPLWTMDNVFITPHTGGETRKYEANVIEILEENLGRLWRGETTLRNQVV